MEIFSRKNIFLDNDFKNKTELFRFVSQKAYIFGYAKSEEDCYQGFVKRESLSTTGFQDGFAIPHSKSLAIEFPQLIFLKSGPIPWNSLDGKDITISFALLVPENGAAEHLKYLSKIAMALMDNDFREKLKNAEMPDEIFSLIQEKLEVN